MSTSLNAALWQLARAAACRWIAWLPFLYNIAKFLLQLSLPMWMGTPTSHNRILWQVLYHYAGDWWECGSAGLWWFAGSERRLQNTHYAGECCGSVQFGSLLGGYMLCEFCQTNIVVSVRDLSGVGQCWIGSLLPCGGLHVL